MKIVVNILFVLVVWCWIERVSESPNSPTFETRDTDKQVGRASLRCVSAVRLPAWPHLYAPPATAPWCTLVHTVSCVRRLSATRVAFGSIK